MICIAGRLKFGLACLITPLVLAPTSAQTPAVPSAAVDGAGWTGQQLAAMKTGCQVIRASPTSVRRLTVMASGTAKATVEARS